MRGEQEIAALVQRMDRTSYLDIEEAWGPLRPLGFAVVPHLLAAYPDFSHGQGRECLVYYAARYARISKEAVALGLTALDDRAYRVRSRACALLAYAQQRDTLSRLKRIAASDARDTVRADAKAAMEAIRRRNHHLYVDRNGSGRSFWHVNPGD